MGSNCCGCSGGSNVQESTHTPVKAPSVITLDDLQQQTAEINDLATEETIDHDVGPSSKPEPEASSSTSRPPEVLEISQEKASPRNLGDDGMSCYRASNTLWTTGSFSDPIPNGFYFVIRDDRLKLFKSIPTLDELRALGDEGVKADVILVDFVKDKKLERLKMLNSKLVDGLKSTPEVIKKISKLVVGFYEQPTPQSSQSNDFPMLGKTKPGSCRLRAILFKVLADAVGLENKLVVGFPDDLESSASFDSNKHMSIVVTLDGEEMVVDLMRSTGRLISMSSSQGISKAHISDTGNDDSCDSPYAPNSLMYSDSMDRINNGSSSRSEPDIATEFLQRSQRMTIGRQLSIPDYPYVRNRERFLPSGDKKPEFSDDASSTKSDGSAKLETKGIMRSLSANPEISDDIGRERDNDNSSPHPPNRTRSLDLQKNKGILLPSSPQNYQSQSSEEWNIDFSELKVGDSVGIGSSAQVFRGTWNETDFAIKIIVNQENQTENIDDFFNEISIHRNLRHPNVVLFLGACTKSPQLSLVTEYMEKGSLYHLLHSTEEIHNLGFGEKLKILFDICRGLMCIHRKGIVHRDLKSANCLLSNDWTVKICDFGLSKTMKGTTMEDTAPAGTPEWVAPEVIRNEPFSEKCDIFSFGVIMWELVTLSKPWEGVPKRQVVDAVANEGARLEIPEGPLSKLIEDCWSEPEQRPSCAEILTRLSTCEEDA